MTSLLSTFSTPKRNLFHNENIIHQVYLTRQLADTIVWERIASVSVNETKSERYNLCYIIQAALNFDEVIKFNVFLASVTRGRNYLYVTVETVSNGHGDRGFMVQTEVNLSYMSFC